MNDRKGRDAETKARIDEGNRTIGARAKPWITGFLLLTAVLLGVVFFAPWE
jgi:hypothetical protein